MELNSPLFQRFTAHVLHWEGTKSRDPDDGAWHCAPFPGAYHTVKGVTYCTFEQMAAALGITPVTYERFLTLTDFDVSKFIYRFYTTSQGNRFNDLIGLSIAEAAWMSGQEIAGETLQKAINELGGNLTVDGAIGPKTIAAGNALAAETLYNKFWEIRIEFLDQLSKKPKWAKYRDGWFNRVGLFLQTFPFGGTGSMVIIGALIAAFIFRKELGIR